MADQLTDEAVQLISILDEVIENPRVAQAVARVENLKQQLVDAKLDLKKALQEAVTTPAAS